MADVNAPSGQTPTMAPPLRADDDQTLPHIRWVPIGKRNCYLDLEKSQSNLIYKIAVDLLKNTNFLRAFTASSTIPSIYIQQFWDTILYDKKAGCYKQMESVSAYIMEKRATLIVIPSIRFTKLIIHHLQRKHRFHSRPDSSLNLSNEELVLGYLKFSAKGTKSEVFRMPIPDRLITIEIQQATYYQEYLSKVANEDADYQKAVEESMKDAYALPKGPLLPVVIREPESGKYQFLLEVPGKGKAKVTEEQSDNEEELEKVVLGAEEGGQDEGQAGPYPDVQAKDQTGSDAGPVVHAGSDREHMDLDVADVSPQPSTEQLDEGFTATVYPNVQENLKLIVEEPVLLEEPASSSGTLSSLQHLSRDFSFGDQYFSDKHLDVDKNAKTEVESMRIGELEHIMAGLIQDNKDMEERLDSHGSRLYTLEQLDIPQRVSIDVSEVVRDAVDWAMQVPLRNHFKDLPEADMKEILHQRMWESDSYKSHEDHMQLFEALEKSMNRDHSEELAQDLAEARKRRKKRRESPKTPPGASGSAQMLPSPPPPSSTNQESPYKGSATPSPSKIAALAKYQAWTTTDIRLRPSISLTPADLQMDEDMALDEQVQSSDDEDIKSAHIPTTRYSRRPVTLPQLWTGSARDEELLSLNLKTWKDLLMRSLKSFIRMHNVSKPLPLGGLPSQVTIQSDIFFNKDLEYLRYGSKGRRPALSIPKMKAAYYPNAGLEKMVPDQF
nr:E-beta-farnesene synthase [Tanacetum cinerariifolium]